MAKKITGTKREINAVSKLLNNINIQKTALQEYCYLKLSIKIIYIMGGVVPKSIFKNINIGKEIDELIAELSILGLIKLDTTLSNETYIILRTQSIQILENKDSKVIQTKDDKKKKIVEEITLNKTTKSLNRLHSRCSILAQVFNIIIDKNNQELNDILDYMISGTNYKELEAIYCPSTNSYYPNKDMLASVKNSPSKVLFKSGIYRVSENKFFLYVDTRDSEYEYMTLNKMISFIKTNFHLDNYLIVTNIINTFVVNKTIEKIDDTDFIITNNMKAIYSSYANVKIAQAVSKILSKFDNVKYKKQNDIIVNGAKIPVGEGLIINIEERLFLIRLNPTTPIKYITNTNDIVDVNINTDLLDVDEIYNILYNKINDFINLYNF